MSEQVGSHKLPASRTGGHHANVQVLFFFFKDRSMEHKEYRHLRQIDDINKIYVVGKKLGRYSWRFSLGAQQHQQPT